MSYIRTSEHRAKMALIKKGKTHGVEARLKISKNHANVSGKNNPMWGKKRSQSVKDAISKANTGRKMTADNKLKLLSRLIGKKHTEETKLRMSLAQLGEKGGNWQGGKTAEHRLVRTRAAYSTWRTAVYKRDNYTCQICGEKGGKLNADHIEPLAKNIDRVYDLGNGRTLCVECHKKTDSYGFNYMWKEYYAQQ